MLSSDIDVDRADFIRRDTHQTGVAYGRYDLDWLISTCNIGTLKTGIPDNKVIGFDTKKAIRVVEQFLIARRALYETVYHHKTVRSAEGMMAVFLRRLRTVILEGTVINVADFVQPIVDIIQGNALSQNELIKLDDFALSVLVDYVSQSNISDITVRDLAQRIRSRDLFKQVPIPHDKLNRYLRLDRAKENLYETIKPFTRGISEYYLVIDETRFKMLSSQDSEKVCLIDDQQNAIYANEHQSFIDYPRDEIEGLRIFTIREAVKAVQECIESSL